MTEHDIRYKICTMFLKCDLRIQLYVGKILQNIKEFAMELDDLCLNPVTYEAEDKHQFS